MFFGLFGRSQPSVDLTNIDDLTRALMGDEFVENQRAREAEYEGEMREITTFLQAGFDRIATAQANALASIDPAGLLARSETSDVKRSTTEANRILLIQADTQWGEYRVSSALTRMSRSRITLTM